MLVRRVAAGGVDLGDAMTEKQREELMDAIREAVDTLEWNGAAYDSSLALTEAKRLRRAAKKAGMWRGK
jgi:hypothetical protein